jgi:stearoyl-CoA 9-desaturase NADPH oxidoreductase
MPAMPTSAAMWTSPWLRPFNDLAAIDDLLAQMHPTWSLGRIKARVLRITDETVDTKTFVLRPNRRWPGHRAGQHVGIEVDIAGVRHQRRYSLSSAPGRERAITITVKRQPSGKVSGWLHDHVGVGDVLTLGAPSGDFVLPSPLPTRLLFLSAGSGITPMMAMLRDLGRRSIRTEVAFVHVTRDAASTIFGRELHALAARSAGLALHVHATASAGRFDVATLDRLVPDWRERPTWLCGPATFMTACRAHWDAAGVASQLRLESFGVLPPPPSATSATASEIRCTRSERVFTTDGSSPLLVAAEHGGLRPRYGCRMGICHTCTCVKQSGTVENLRTGEISSEPGERIQLCISRARTDCTLEL